MESGKGVSMSAKIMGYWAATVIAALAFVVPGVLNLIHFPHIAQDMAQLGYPPYVMNILGAWKILGALTLLAPGFPRLKEWAYAGMIFDLTGAAMSRAFSGSEPVLMFVPLFIALIVITSWFLRPDSRRLKNG